MLRIRYTCSFLAGRRLAVPFMAVARPGQHHLSTTATSSLALTNQTISRNNNNNNLDMQDWRLHPDLNPLLELHTWLVPSQHVQQVIRSPLLQPYFFHSVSMSSLKKIRIVQTYNTTHQLVLRSQDIMMDEYTEHVIQLLQEYDIRDGPVHSIQLDPSYFSVQDKLSLLLPPNTPLPTSYEQVGHVLHFNLKPHLLPYRYIIGQVFLESLPGIETVIDKVGQVDGPHRLYDFQVLAGNNDTRVTVVEDGLSFEFDLAQVYWCSRLAGERQYMLQHVFERNQTIVDVFCGVGALCVLAAHKLQCRVCANDWNLHAIESLKESAKRHHVDTNIQTTCMDAYEYLVDLGLQQSPQTLLPDHVVMNYPLEAPSFLNALRWWKIPRSKQTTTIPWIHVYTFSSSLEEAVDVVAHNLLPESSEVTPNRESHLNELGCQVHAREIRDVAPNKLVVCVSFKATAQLLRHMQGDYV